MARFVVGLSLVVLVASLAFTQNPDDPGAGILPFSTQVGAASDSIDLATSNINVRIPVRSKTGKMPFDFSLVWNSHAWIGQYPTGGLRWQITTSLTGGPSGNTG